MRTPRIVSPILGALIIAAAAWLWACSPLGRDASIPSATITFTAHAGSPSPTAAKIPTAAMPPQKSWILIDLPPGATQLQYGAEVYRLVCKACHGDIGQGLTDAWRATWAPQDQNCWQSKCHGPDRPPDGFALPVAPAVAGSAAMSLFATAQDLHDFVQRKMPWQDPGSLTSKDSWAATAYILKMNRIDPGPELGSATADNIAICSARALPAVAVTPFAAVGTSDQQYSAWILAGAALAAFGLFVAVRALRRRASGTRTD